MHILKIRRSLHSFGLWNWLLLAALVVAVLMTIAKLTEFDREQFGDYARGIRDRAARLITEPPAKIPRTLSR